ncbi:helix-turn-helix domain-containing protein [Pseudorhizobium sp. NPDC055634]
MTRHDTLTRSSSSRAGVGAVLREWRSRRRMSQLDLALDAEISARHLSFVESGRSSPSRDLLLRLAERLSMPLRAQNRLMMSAGYAPIYGVEALDAPELAEIRQTVEAILAGHMPFPRRAARTADAGKRAGAALHLDHDRFQHRHQRHALRTGARMLLPGRSRDTGGPDQTGRKGCPDERYLSDRVRREACREGAFPFAAERRSGRHEDVLSVQLARPYRTAWNEALPELLASERTFSMWQPLRSDTGA